MKKIIVLLAIIICVFIQVAGCTKNNTSSIKNDDQIVKNKSKNISRKSENDIKEIAYQSLSEDDKKTVISWKDAKVEDYKTTDNHPLGSRIGPANIKDRDTYRINFKTKDEWLLGPLVVYVDKNSYDIIGFDLRN